jgi:hypothetical protein
VLTQHPSGTARHAFVATAWLPAQNTAYAALSTKHNELCISPALPAQGSAMQPLLPCTPSHAAMVALAARAGRPTPCSALGRHLAPAG